jgi:hypothetical protein
MEIQIFFSKPSVKKCNSLQSKSVTAAELNEEFNLSMTECLSLHVV